MIKNRTKDKVFHIIVTLTVNYRFGKLMSKMPFNFCFDSNPIFDIFSNCYMLTN